MAAHVERGQDKNHRATPDHDSALDMEYRLHGVESNQTADVGVGIYTKRRLQVQGG